MDNFLHPSFTLIDPSLKAFLWKLFSKVVVEGKEKKLAVDEALLSGIIFN